MDKIKKAFQFLTVNINKLRLILLPYWKKLWYFSNFNKSRYSQLSSLKKIASWLYSFVIGFVLFIIAFEINFLWIFGHMPSMKEVRNPKIALVTEVYSADKKLMGTFFVEQRTPVDFNEIHPKTIEALLATEDIRFYKHHGLDLYALSAAFVATIKGNKRGGSTITQQLVKNVYRTRNFGSKGLLGYIPLVRTIIAKLKEWITALKIEFYYSKEEILTMYFNVVDFGNNSYGIKTASEFYFSKSPNKRVPYWLDYLKPHLITILKTAFKGLPSAAMWFYLKWPNTILSTKKKKKLTARKKLNCESKKLFTNKGLLLILEQHW